ncbi:MAG: hypothetical protein QXU75_03485 [Candidatus Methanomethylicaceae archaeon]
MNRACVIVVVCLAILVLGTCVVCGQCLSGQCRIVGPAISLPPSRSTLVETKLVIQCEPDDLVSVMGVQLKSQGSERTVVWQLEPGRYEADVVVERGGVKRHYVVSMRAGETTHFRVPDDIAHAEHKPDPTNFGLDLDKLGSEAGTVTGTLTREDVERYIAATKERLRVTVIADKSRHDVIRKELSQLSDVLVQVYEPEHWALERARISPLPNVPATLVVQSPQGNVLLKTEYRDVNSVKQAIEQVRSPQQPSVLDKIPWWGWLVIAFLAYKLLLARTQNNKEK